MRLLKSLLFAFFAVTAQSAGKPNVLFIFTDDQAPRAVRAAGDPRFITPHIDRIFDEGAHLRNAFVVTPVCSPSRVELIASRYGTEMGITDYINRREDRLGIPEGTPTWPALLSAAGYRTALVGKWHLGVEDRHHPTRFGYDYFMGMRTGGSPPNDPTLEAPGGQSRKYSGYTCDILTDHAIDFIRRESAAPFLVSLHFRAPHAAWLPVRPEDWSPFEDLDPEIPNPDYPNLDVPLIKKRTREYLAAVKSIDRNVGRLLELLDDLSLANNTIVIFTSDHGYNLGEHGVWYKGNAIRALTKNPPQRWEHIPANRRPNMWDTSLRVPVAVRWPGTIRPGTKIDRTVSNLDWFPTVLALCGIQTPANVTIRGRDFASFLRGKDVPWNDDLYAEYSMHHGATTHMRTWRTPRWKFMKDFANPGREELYDLQSDPGETTNLVRSKIRRHAEIREQLLAKIHRQMKAINDPAFREAKDIPFEANIDLTEQRYVELLPPDYRSGRPTDVLIALHGHGSDRWQFIRQKRPECRAVRDVARRRGMILISPDYRAKTSWMGPQAEADLVQIIGEVKQRHSVRRVILSGASMGGASSLTFTALRPDLVDGVVSMNGTANHVDYQNFQDAIRRSFGGTKEEIPAEYRKRSAEYWSQRFTMPVAFTVGGKDRSVPPDSVIRLAEKLKAGGRQTLLIHREQGGHSTTYDDAVAALDFVCSARRLP